jgi:hypothetical protein
MRRISWISQRMRCGVPGAASVFLGCRLVRVMADHCQPGEGQHHQRHVAVPPVLGSGSVCVRPSSLWRS